MQRTARPLNKTIPQYNDEYSALALDVYRDKDRPPIPSYLTWLCDCPPELQSKDYFGAAYYANSGDYVHIYIAHRGTILSFENLIDDLLIALGKAPRTFESNAKPFIEYVKKQVSSKLPQKKISVINHTGHSLGAILAELFVALGSDSYSVSGRTFESPGSKPIIKDLMNQGKLPRDALARTQSLVTIYNADVNVINSCNEQATDLRAYLCSVGYDFSSIQSIFPVSIAYYLTKFTPDQHSMLKMYRFMQGTVHWETFPQDVAGLGYGYSFYKKYQDYRHRYYWDAALKIYWDTNLDIQKQYHGDYGAYRSFMLKTYFPDGIKLIPSLPAVLKTPTEDKEAIIVKHYQFFKTYHDTEQKSLQLEGKFEEQEYLSTEELAQLKKIRIQKNELDETYAARINKLEEELDKKDELPVEKRRELKLLYMLLAETNTLDELKDKETRISTLFSCT